MKKLIIIFLTTVIAFVCHAQENTMNWRYEIQCVDIAKEGGSLVKVFTYAKTRKIALEEAKKSAVHGILFKGFIGNGKCASQKPLVKNPTAETENRDFFNVFFQDGGKFEKYVTLSTDGNIDPNDIVKVGKEYKLGMIVTIAKDALRKDLEPAGIIKNIADRY